MRLRRVKDALEIVEASKYIVLNPEEYKGKFNTLFNNDNPIHVEIGMGKGDYVVGMAEKYPDINFIGIEKYESVMVRGVQKLEDTDYKNLKLLHMDALNICDVFDHEIDTIYLNFSDPWPKARHEKRRLSSPRFMDMYKVILNDGGIFRIKTDNVPLYEYSLESTLPYLDNPTYGERIYADGEITTEFEEKFRKLGNKIYYIEGKIKK